ncbi:MAG: penicillin acylase family protein [Proteobacteria bacterium]|nr:penicillin acylase family protein [Pseudomonadota bacterium]
MRKLKLIGAFALVLLVAAVGAAYLALHASLPATEGTLTLAGLEAPVTVARDDRGVPTLTAASRADLAFGTGFVHAQDRFFEMDLSRRLAAGELSELVGAAALGQDRRARLFRFRAVATEVLAGLTPQQRAVVSAYTRGVNAGLGSLAARPWEYFVLRQPPAPWREEDTLLVVYAMWWDLQAGGLRREILRQKINARLSGPECAHGWKCALKFLYPRGTSWDAANSPAQVPVTPEPIPGPDVLDVHGSPAAARLPPMPHAPLPGSNSWAVAGAHTASGAALVANDMHLAQRVPTIWYHARLRLAAGAGAPALDLNGVTLPGAPVLVAGSNGAIAWGFTNSYGDWLEVHSRECSAVDEAGLHTAAGVVPLTVVHENIRVHGAADFDLAVRSGPEGLLLRVDGAEHTCWFGSWLAQNPHSTNMNLMALEQVSNAADALALAPTIGIPHQNFVVGDAQGHIGWTIFGLIPAGTEAARAQGSGPWVQGAEHPRIYDPAAGRLWTANAQVTGDPQQLATIGGHVAELGSQYDLGARASQIRDDLLALSAPAQPADMLAIQRDDRALFLARWRELLLGVLDAPSVAGHPARVQFRALVEHWDARAGVDSVGYRLVRAYHDRVQQSVWDSILAALKVPGEADSDVPAQFEGPLWQLVTERPAHMLGRAYATWPQFLQAQVDATVEDLGPHCPDLSACSWGRHNRVWIRHPLSRSLPGLSHLLDMPPLELPGDHDMPRVQEGAFGASERFAVSPGHEADGYLVLPGGQSGHPLSPYYRAGFMGWVDGERLPFLPGPARATLTLQPKAADAHP